MKRTLILAAWLTLGAWVSADAASWKFERVFSRDGSAVMVVEFIPGTVDTSQFVGVDVANNVNDSLIFNSPPFDVQATWTVAWVRGFYAAGFQDTTTTLDTIGYLLQTKCEDLSDSAWHQIAVCAKADEDQINNLPATFDMKAFADADSTFICDAYRLRVALVAEEAQWRLEASAANGGDAGFIPFNSKYRFYMYFVDKGNQ